MIESLRQARAVIRRHDPGRALLLELVDPLPTACGRLQCDGCPHCRLLDANASLERTLSGAPPVAGC